MKALKILSIAGFVLLPFTQVVYGAQILEKMENKTVKIMTEGERFVLGDEFHVYRTHFREVGKNSEQGGFWVPVQTHVAHGQVTQVLDNKTALAKLTQNIDLNQKLSIQKVD